MAKGGKRIGAGRKRKFEDPTFLNLKIEQSVKKILVEKYKKCLNTAILQMIQENML